MRNWAKLDTRYEPRTVLVAVQTCASTSVLPLIVSGGIRHNVCFLILVDTHTRNEYECPLCIV